MISFNRFAFDSGELKKVQEAVENGHISGNGPFSLKSESILSEMHPGSRALLTTSCSHSLELAARLIMIEPGDEVIVPSYTFVTSVSSFFAQGARPVFCDIDPVTLGLDLQMAKTLVTPRTKAIVLVHYGGVPANPEGFARLAQEHNLTLIEDNAHGLGGKSEGKALGTFGAMSALSFHETKNISCGEGGALVINDPSFFERAEILREKGTDRSKFLRGEVDKYTWQDLGSSWVLSDLLAAVLYAQLSDFQGLQERRQEKWSAYYSGLRDWAATRGYGLQVSTSGTAHLFYLLLSNEAEQIAFIEYMKKERIHVTSHYQPLHRSPFASKFLTGSPSLPITEKVSSSLVRLPLSSGLTNHEQDRVISSALNFS